MPTREDEIREALERIRVANGGRLTKEAVVRAARNARHTLHREFIWNDRDAAHRQRLERAGELIVRFVTIKIVHRSMHISAPFYVKDPSVPTNTPGYVPLTSADIDRNAAMQILLKEVERCESSIERARDICAVLDSNHPGLSEVFERMLQELVDLRQRLAA